MNETRTLSEIAKEIMAVWPDAGDEYHPAGAYAVPMLALKTVRDAYGYDSAASIVRYFLANAQGWRGEDARRIKAELKEMIKGVY